MPAPRWLKSSAHQRRDVTVFHSLVRLRLAVSRREFKGEQAGRAEQADKAEGRTWQASCNVDSDHSNKILEEHSVIARSHRQAAGYVTMQSRVSLDVCELI